MKRPQEYPMVPTPVTISGVSTNFSQPSKPDTDLFHSKEPSFSINGLRVHVSQDTRTVKPPPGQRLIHETFTNNYHGLLYKAVSRHQGRLTENPFSVFYDPRPEGV